MSITHNTPGNIPAANEILSSDALAFVEALHEKFADRREELLGKRETARAKAADSGTMDFLP